MGSRRRISLTLLIDIFFSYKYFLDAVRSIDAFNPLSTVARPYTTVVRVSEARQLSLNDTKLSPVMCEVKKNYI